MGVLQRIRRDFRYLGARSFAQGRERRSRPARNLRISLPVEGGEAVSAPHVPVLLDEVVDGLAIVPGERHIDATFGAGGYTKAILDRGAEVAAFDRDPDAIEGGRTLV